MIYLQLCIEFFKIGLFSVGGGLATLPFLYSMAERYPWFTKAELTQMIAVSESTPGPLGVNMATYVGMKTAGPLGGILATLCLVLPGLIIIILIAHTLEKFQKNQLVQNVFGGLRPAVVGMIAFSATSVLESAFFLAGTDFSSFSLGTLDWRNIILFFVLLFAVFKWKKHPILYIAVGAIIGIVFQF
ncbi:MAG: chromate transporter [Clostridiales bacterium]|jgi:chromate transporter|nr:chromate transporter [Clostridiales bacterium]MCI1962015.1 chromate transporter [Clostridiales bacterium]MCI2022252.1 chromate transporter [Clostridiales bacterium]MCI2026649.1 chromate transporter [Clostridiales bacterium]